jgi:hypothetical protein
MIVQAATTFTVNEQDGGVLPGAAAEQVTVVVPMEKLCPEAGVQLTKVLQLFVTIGGVYVTCFVPEPGGFSITSTLFGQTPSAGVRLSTTVTVKGTTAASVFPLVATV